MKRWNRFVNSPAFMRCVSVALVLYFSMARLGETGSYFEAFNAAAIFALIWLLGMASVKTPAEPGDPKTSSRRAMGEVAE